MLVRKLRALSKLCVRKTNLMFIKFLQEKILIYRKKYKIAKEFDIKVFRGQLDILVYYSIAEICTNP